MVLGLTGRVANRYAVVMVCDSGEKCFAPTLVVGVGADWLGCIQGARCLWVAIRAKNISPLHWMVVLGLTVGLQTGHAVLLVAFRAKNISPLHCLVVLGLTNRVANRYAVLLVAIGVKNILVVHLVAHLAAVR